MPKTLLLLSAFALLLFSCESGPKAPAKPPVDHEKVIAAAHQTNLETSTLVTGWYHVIEDSNGFARTMDDFPETLFIDPKPIVTKAHVKEAFISESDYGGKNISLEFEETGAKAWADATEKAIDKKVACIIDDVLSFIWSPDSSQIVYTQRGREQQPINIYDLDTEQLYTIAYHEPDVLVGWRAD